MRSGRLHLGKRERLTFSSIIRIWRLVLLVVVAQLLGGVGGLLLLPRYDSFTNSWIGGTLAAPVGFLAGLWWQLASRDRRHDTRLDLVLFIALLTCLAAPIGALAAVRSEQDFQARLDAFRALPADSVRRITCYDKHGRERLVTIEDAEALQAFARACRDAQGYGPNHPHYWESWYVVVEGDKTIELECHFEQGRGDQLVAYFVEKRGDWTGYYGSFISTDLRPWFEQHVEQPPARPAGVHQDEQPQPTAPRETDAGHDPAHP